MMGRNRYSAILATILATAALVVAGNACAQTFQASLTHYSTDNGLSSNAISKIRQDDYGFLWIATWNGLNRFDGYDFYTYETGAISQIPNLHNRISSLAIDKSQNVWMNMYDHRIFVMKRSEDRIINPFEGIAGSEDFQISIPLTVISNGDVLAVVDGVGIYKLRLDNQGLKAQLVTTSELKVTDMAEGYQNDIWLATDQGIHRMDVENLSVERKGYFLDEHINSIFSDGFNIYAGTESGKIVAFAYGQEPQQLRATGEPINRVFADSHGLIWFSDTRVGVGYLDSKTMKEKMFVQEVKFPDYDGYGGEFNEVEGTVWARLNHGGYGYYDRETDQFRYFYNSPESEWSLSNTVYAFLELKEGVVWESTSRQGLEKLEILKNIIERRQLVVNDASTLSNEIRAMFYDKQRHSLLIGNKKGALFLIGDDGSKQEISSDSQGRQIGRIYGISTDSKGNIWLSSKDNGLFKMTHTGSGYSIRNYCHDDSDEHSLGDNHAYQTVEDAEGNIWVATYGGGVNMMPKGSERFIRADEITGYPQSAFRKVRAIAIDREGTVWAGTTDGLLLLTKKGNDITAAKMEPSYEKPDMIMRSHDIVCMNTDSLGTIWLGTNSGGLSHEIGKDSQGHILFENFGVSDGLPSDGVKSITFDKNGSLWFSTDYMICSFNREKRIISTYSRLEGVDETMCSESSAITLPDGRILFGTLNGYYIIDQEKLKTTAGSMLKLHLTDFWMDGVLQSPRFTDDFDYYVPEARKVVLKKRPSEIKFRFASLDYRLQHRVHYQYMLEGYEDEWRYSDKSRTATYYNLPGGTYRLIVQAFLQESPEMKDQLEIEIVVPSSFFHSSLSIWLYIIGAIILCIWLLFLRQNQIKRKLSRINHPQNKMTGSGHDEFEQDPMLIHRKSGYTFMVQLMTWLDNHYSDPNASEDEMTESTDMSRAEFIEELKAIADKSPRQFLNDFRISKAREFLEETEKSVDEICQMTGFTDRDQFELAFTIKLKMSPEQYREKKQKEDTDEYEIIE